MDNRDCLRGISNQDQEIAEILTSWANTDNDMKAEFLEMLEVDDIPKLRKMIDDSPDQWLWFFQKCCVAGLRQAVLQSMQE